MTKLVLTFNAKAAELLGSNTRLRVKSMKRGGQEYVALRPSYRVSGKNAMIRVNKAEDGTVTAEITDDLQTELGLPQVKSNHTPHLFEDVGYGWFLLKDGSEANEKKDPIIVIHKTRKGTPRKAADEAGTTDDTTTNGSEDTGAANDDTTATNSDDTTATTDAGGAEASETAPAKKTTKRSHKAKPKTEEAPASEEGKGEPEAA